MLEVFTHKSLRGFQPPGTEHEEFGNNERLSELGEKILEMVATACLFKRKPLYSREEIIVSESAVH